MSEKNKIQHSRLKIVTLLLSFAVFFWVILVPFASKTFAQSNFGIDCPPGTVYIAIFDMCLDFANTIGLGVSWSIILGTAIALIKFGIGAIQMIMSTGQPTKLENARTVITDAVLGFVMIVSAWALLTYVSKTFPAEWQINFFVLPFGLGGPNP